MLGREEDARDATQDAFLSALRKLSSFRGDAAFTTWMHRVTVNACYDILRKRKREPALELPEGIETGSPHDHAESTVVSIDVQRALLHVPQEFRAALVLHDVQDLAYEDVAEILGVPIGTVQSRTHRGRVALAGQAHMVLVALPELDVPPDTVRPGLERRAPRWKRDRFRRTAWATGFAAAAGIVAILALVLVSNPAGNNAPSTAGGAASEA